MLDKITNPPVRTFSSTNLRITISLLLVTGLLALTVSCDLFGGSDSEPKTGSVVVDVSTSGTDKDNNGYTVVLAADSQSVSATGKVTFSGLPTGDRELSIGGVAENCAIEGNNPRTLSVKAGQTVTEKVAITCSQKTGSVTVDVTTTGDDTDPDGYTLTVADRSQSVGPNGSVTFTDLPVGDHDLAVANIASNCSVDGANPRTVTVEDGQETTEAVTVSCSAETGGTGIVFDRLKTGEISSGDIWIMNADGSDKTALTDTGFEMLRPVWWPDGSKILFDNADESNLSTIKPDGSNLKNITPDLWTAVDPDIGPNGERIVARVQPESNDDANDLRLLDAQTGEIIRRLTYEGDVTRVPSNPELSPDGSKVAFSSYRDGNWEIYVVNTDGSGQPTRLTNSSAGESTPAYSPDGSEIAFGRDGGLWIMDADGSNQQMLIESGGGPAWSPNGQEIAFVRQTAETFDIYRMDADGSNVTPLVESDNWHEIHMDWR